MTKMYTKILILLGALALLIAGVSAAPIYTIETTALTEDKAGGNDGYYILNGSALTLPLTVEYNPDTTAGESHLSRMEITTTIAEGNTQVSDLTYQYKLSNDFPTGIMNGSISGKEWIYSVTTGADVKTLTGIKSNAITLTIPNLPYSENPYTVSMDIYAGDGLKDWIAAVPTQLGKDLRVYHLYQGTNATNEGVWNMTYPLTVTTDLLNGTNVPKATHEIPWDTKTIGTASVSLAVDNETYFTVQKKSGDDYIEAEKSSVKDITSTRLSLEIGENDNGADSYRLIFEGYRKGDVTDLNPNAANPVNLADVDLILYKVTGYDYIDAERLIYGDINNDGLIGGIDAHYVYYYYTNGVEQYPSGQYP